MATICACVDAIQRSLHVADIHGPRIACLGNSYRIAACSEPLAAATVGVL